MARSSLRCFYSGLPVKLRHDSLGPGIAFGNIQWRIEARGPGGAASPLPPHFWTKAEASLLSLCGVTLYWS